jgi:hypothetical protein
MATLIKTLIVIIAVVCGGLLPAGAGTSTATSPVLVTNLVEILAFVQKVSEALELDIKSPLTTNDVTRFRPWRGTGSATSLVIADRWNFAFDVDTRVIWGVTDRHRSLSVLWRAEDIKPLIHPSTITKAQALDMARRYLKRLGYDETGFPLLPPKVEQWEWKPPGVEKAEMLPYFIVVWPWAKHAHMEYFSFEIDGIHKQVTRFSTRYPRQDPPASEDN